MPRKWVFKIVARKTVLMMFLSKIESDSRISKGKLREIPTEYFEAKITREVDLAEFSGAVVPRGVDSESLMR